MANGLRHTSGPVQPNPTVTSMPKILCAAITQWTTIPLKLLHNLWMAPKTFLEIRDGKIALTA